MAKKKKLQSTAPVPLTRGQLSRAQKEQQRIRNLYTAGIIIAVVIVLVLGFAAISTFIIRPNTEVASVNGVKITRATYDKLRSWNLYQQIEQTAIQQQLDTTGTGTSSTDLTTYEQQLKNVDTESPLDDSTIQALVDDEVLRQKSTSDFQINPTTDDLKAEALKDFIPSPTPPPSSETPTVGPTDTATVITTPTPTSHSSVTPSPTITQTPTQTPTKGTPTATDTATATYPPVPGASATAQAVYNRYIAAIKAGPDPNNNDTTGICTFGCPGLSEQDYLSIVIDPRARQNMVTDKLAATIITDVEQIHVQNIITTSQAGADTLHQQLDKGADFSNLANQQSSDQIANIQNGAQGNGGDLGWLPKDPDLNTLPSNVVSATWSLPVGQYSQPVQSGTNWYIIKVLERNPKMPLTSDQISTKKTALYNNWFNNAKLTSQISPASAQAPTPTAPPLIEPTLPPVATTTPGASSPITGTGTLTGTTGTTATSTAGTSSTGGTTPTAAGTSPPSTAPPSSGNTGGVGTPAVTNTP